MISSHHFFEKKNIFQAKSSRQLLKFDTGNNFVKIYFIATMQFVVSLLTTKNIFDLLLFFVKCPSPGVKRNISDDYKLTSVIEN